MATSGKIHENVELESFLVTKHSVWKGKYKRILTIGSHGLSTYNPEKFDLTNRWPYSDVISVAPNKTGNVSAPIILNRSLFRAVFLIVFHCFCRIPTSSLSHWKKRRKSTPSVFRRSIKTTFSLLCWSFTRTLQSVLVTFRNLTLESIIGRV